MGLRELAEVIGVDYMQLHKRIARARVRGNDYPRYSHVEVTGHRGRPRYLFEKDAFLSWWKMQPPIRTNRRTP